MRARPWLLTSVGLNLFLAVSWWVAREPLEDKTVVIPAYHPELDIKTNVVVRHENFTWDQIESPDYATLIKNLRDLGCPEQTIRDIVITDVDREFDRRRATEIVAPDYQWWKAEPDASLVQAATAQAQALEKERATLLTTLLGPGWQAASPYAIASRAGISLTGPLLGELPDGVKQNVLNIVAHGQARIDAYLQTQRDAGLPADPMEMARLRQQFLLQMVVVLTPEQYEEFVLRYAQGAQLLRQQTRGLDLTPDTFRGLFGALTPITSQPVYYYAGSDAATLRQQADLKAQEDATMKSVLGDAVYAAYTMERDPMFRSVRDTAQQLGVPTASVAALYEINRATQTELDRIRNDATLSADEKVDALSQTQVDQHQSLQQLLGPKLFEKWLKSGTEAAR